MQWYYLVIMIVEFIILDYLIRHSNPKGLHGMIDCVVVCADHAIEIVYNIFFEIHPY
jgi:hypothetical protein